MKPKFEIKTNKTTTVWINADNGECLGRFDKRWGIDIHNTLENQSETGEQCLYCRHGKMTRENWMAFIYYMAYFHNVVVTNDLLSW